MFRPLFRFGLALVALVLLQPATAAPTGQQQLVDRAQTTLSNFLRDPQMSWLQKNLPRAKGVLIAPEVVKAGFIFGGSGGRAVLLARDAETGEWRGPVFYTLATASFGFQAGVAGSENITLVMTEKGLNSLLATSVKLGGDASIAAGPVGAGASGDIAADFVSFARSKGVYGGLNLDGTVITATDDWNNAYYGKTVLPPDVVVRGTATNPQAGALLEMVSKATK
ncbi:MAG TPA: lipid-binding SYLF domain-containing protein [Casimicrobiaceae bacterium]|nr:lipid-binding SYLF domain-containing protein [Casimicrobiaceae bacterium]